MATNLRSERIAPQGIVETNPDNLREYMLALKEDALAAAIEAAVPVHHVADGDVSGVPAAPSDLPESVAFVNAMKSIINAHFLSAHPTGVHPSASTEVIVAANATDQGTSDTLVTEIILDYNTHRTEANVHITDDAANVMAGVPDGTLPTLITCCTSVRDEYLAHLDAALAMHAGTVE